MRISQLELVGFKSFVDRTKLTFPPGVAAIVGPNGCGKSNLVDAVRWVLGEQSPKQLRGAGMEDVIFAGNERRPPLGMAEVSLTFVQDGAEEEVPGPEAAEGCSLPSALRGLPELTITRRYYRSGESEYFINRTPCRLKDITELFLGTGLGSRAYAIVEQGRVEQLVQAKPEERRLVIEEAAGTTLYRSRRLAAERKMERTRENLLRVSDVLREVERQIQYLNRQAKKAAEFRALQARLRAVELSLARRQWLALTAEIERAQSAVERLRAEERALGEHAEACEAWRGAVSSRMAEVGEELSRLREGQARTAAEVEAKQQRQAWLEEQVREREQRAERAAAQRGALGERLQCLRQEAEIAAREQQVCTESLASEEQRLRDWQRAWEERRSVSAGARERAEAAKEQLVSVLARLADTRNRMSGIEQRLRESAQHAQRLSSERDQLDERYRAVQQQAARQRQELQAKEQRLVELGNERHRRAAELERVAAACGAAEQRLEEIERQLLFLRSRAASVRELQRNYEGYQPGVRSILLERRPTDGVLGVVADVIRAPQEYERAVAAALGERLQYVIVRAEEDGVGAVQLLRSEARGRGSFIPRVPRRWRTGGEALPGANGDTARLLDLIRVDEGFQEVAESLLGDVVLVPDLGTALGLWRRNGTRVTMVTPEGDVLDASGIVTGGSDRPFEEEILARKRELAELDAAAEALEAERATAAAELEKWAERRAADEAALSELETLRQELALSAVALRKDCERLEAEQPRLAEGRRVLEAELEAAARESALLRRELEELGAEFRSLEGERARIEGELQGELDAASQMGREAEALAEEVAAARVRVAELRERAAAMAARHEQLEAEGRRLAEQIERLCAEERDARRERAELAAGAGAIASEIAAAAETCRALAERIAETARELEDLRAAAQRCEQECARSRSALEARRAERAGVETQLAEKRVHREHLEQAAREKHGFELPGEQQEVLESPVEELAAELDELRQRLARIGDVNPGAVEELAELEERARFLRAQKEDIERSLADLERTIARLNRASRQRFQESFHCVDREFRRVFPRLFGGGEAQLVLTDPHNLLESGVEIQVRLPGKKNAGVHLLSGGEKALVAVSLIFALFLSNPSPFCMLDEIDAPLDDANVGRFVRIVQDLKARSQFILVTHNKRTMEAADCLYGVTMEEPGVSKVVAVSLRGD